MLKDINEEQLDLIIGLLQSYFLFAVIGFAVIIAIAAIIVKVKAPQQMEKFIHIALGISLGLSLCIIFTIMSLTLARYTLKGRINTSFWLSTGLLIGACALILIGVILKLIKPGAFKTYALISIVLIAVYSIVLVIIAPTKDGYTPENSMVYYICSAVLIAVMAIMYFFGGKSASHTTKSVTYAAVCLAMSFALSYVKFFSLPQGGSVTLASLLPLMIYSYMFGVKKGLLCGLLYGLLQFMQSPVLYQPMQFFLDYPLAFGFIGLSGIMRGFKPFKGNRFIEFCTGSVITVILRFACHVVSGVFVFYSYAGDQNPLIYSLAYNSFAFVDMAIAIVAGVLLLLNKSFTNRVCNIEQTK